MLEPYTHVWTVVTLLFILMILPTCGHFQIKYQTRGQSLPSTDAVPPDIENLVPALDLEKSIIYDVQVNAGDAAYLPCKYRPLGLVSWIRRTDWHILYTGTSKYTTDSRFQLYHKLGSVDWTLRLGGAKAKDRGTYECQMYTESGSLSQFVKLNVTEATAVILGPRERTVLEGETIALVCVVQQVKPSFVFWFQGDNTLNPQRSDDRVIVETQEQEGGKIRSRLTIQRAMYSDTGNYYCVSLVAESASVLVQVTRGKTTPAYSRWVASKATNQESSLFKILVMTFIFSHLSLCKICLLVNGTIR